MINSDDVHMKSDKSRDGQVSIIMTAPVLELILNTVMDKDKDFKLLNINYRMNQDMYEFILKVQPGDENWRHIPEATELPQMLGGFCEEFEEFKLVRQLRIKQDKR